MHCICTYAEKFSQSVLTFTHTHHKKSFNKQATGHHQDMHQNKNKAKSQVQCPLQHKKKIARGTVGNFWHDLNLTKKILEKMQPCSEIYSLVSIFNKIKHI